MGEITRRPTRPWAARWWSGCARPLRGRRASDGIQREDWRARLSGSRAVTIFDVGEWRGQPFLVMQHSAAARSRIAFEGRSAASRQVMVWLDQVAETLDSAPLRHRAPGRQAGEPPRLRGDLRLRLRIASAAGLDSMTHGDDHGNRGLPLPRAGAGGGAPEATSRARHRGLQLLVTAFRGDSPASRPRHAHAPVPPIASAATTCHRARSGLSPGAGQGPSRALRLGGNSSRRFARRSPRPPRQRCCAARPPRRASACGNSRPRPGPVALLLGAAAAGAIAVVLTRMTRRRYARSPAPRNDHGSANGHPARASTTSGASTAAGDRCRTRRAHAQRPRLLAAATRRLHRRAPAPSAGRQEAQRHRPRRSVRGLCQLQPRLHPLQAGTLPGGGHLPEPRRAARDRPARAKTAAQARRALLGQPLEYCFS